MKFHIEYTDNIGIQELQYIEDERSFYMEYSILNVDIELIINKIALQVFNNEIRELSGFCGLSREMRANFQVPHSKKGILKVEHNLQLGLAYEINEIFDYEHPIYLNIETGWVCIGNPNIEEKAVEFITNCIAVINENGAFIALWLKPKSLPKNL